MYSKQEQNLILYQKAKQKITIHLILYFAIFHNFLAHICVKNIGNSRCLSAASYITFCHLIDAAIFKHSFSVIFLS